MSALTAFRSTGRNRWDKSLAAHLLNRTGFGALPEDIDQAVTSGMERTVDYLVDFEKAEDVDLPPPETPELLDNPRQALAGLSEEERRKKLQEFNRTNRQAIDEIRSWWIRRMLRTRRPLREKMTLFWHGHFATSAEDVKRARLMLKQNEFLRQNCLGNFRDLLLGISRDPAMLAYLDNNTNRKQHPNENYARELMELFSMGLGNYSEDDVRAAARAFTGWTFRGETYEFNERWHDDGVKTFLDHTGNLDGADIIDIILQQPCTARFMAGKLLRFFVCDNPAPQQIEELAALIRTHDYEFKPVLRALFKSEVFYSAKAYRTQIKSPAQLVVGSVRALGVTVNERPLALTMRGLGQDLLFPPNVKGWDGGEAWINTQTLLMRYNAAGFLLGGKFAGGGNPKRPDQRRFQFERNGPTQNRLNEICGPQTVSDAPLLVDTLATRLLYLRLDANARQWLIEQAETTPASQRPTIIAHLIMSMPDYQLC